MSGSSAQLKLTSRAPGELRATYEADRAARDAAHPPIFDPSRCRYCGKHWYRFGGTQFEGHVTCAVSQEFLHAIVDVLDSGVSYVSVGLEIGVSHNIVRAWWRTMKR